MDCDKNIQLKTLLKWFDNNFTDIFHHVNCRRKADYETVKQQK